MRIPSRASERSATSPAASARASRSPARRIGRSKLVLHGRADGSARRRRDGEGREHHPRAQGTASSRVLHRSATASTRSSAFRPHLRSSARRPGRRPPHGRDRQERDRLDDHRRRRPQRGLVGGRIGSRRWPRASTPPVGRDGRQRHEALVPGMFQIGGSALRACAPGFLTPYKKGDWPSCTGFPLGTLQKSGLLGKTCSPEKPVVPQVVAPLDEALGLPRRLHGGVPSPAAVANPSPQARAVAEIHSPLARMCNSLNRMRRGKCASRVRLWMYMLTRGNRPPCRSLRLSPAADPARGGGRAAFCA